MTTGSLCFTEILRSRKPCSSNSEHSHNADSTSASGVALPYFSNSRLSSDPAFTPIRIGTPAAPAASAISLTLSSNCLILPGFTRTAAQPASIAANTYFGWKWMSAITGIWLCLAISGSASASSWEGQATRTMSQPAAVSSAICCSVALTSDVSVVVIDCTETGASPPTATDPTLICRDLRRGARTGGGAEGIPRETVTIPLSAEVDRLDDVGVEREQRQHDEDGRDRVHHRQHLRRVDEDRTPGAGRFRVTAGPQPGASALGRLDQRTGDMAAVERQQRQQVEEEQQQVDAGQQVDEDVRLVLDVQLGAAGVVAGDPADADHADGTVGVALLALEDRLPQALELLGVAAERLQPEIDLPA